jgi:phosphoserine phosphatase
MATHLILQGPDVATPLIKDVARRVEATSIEGLPPGALHEAFRLREVRISPELEAEIADLCARASVDCAFVPDDMRLEQVGAIAMDMDSTLITIECIDEIADMQGLKPQVAAITASAMRGEIDFSESLRRRVALLGGLDVAALDRVYRERLQLSPGAESMLHAFRSVQAQTLLVSGGFTFFTDRLRQRLGFDHTISNTLEIVDGKLTGRVAGDIVDAGVKAAWLTKLRSHMAPGQIAVGIGDGANDLPMLAAADVSIAYRAKPVVREATDYAINYCGLDAVVNLFA